MKLILVSAALFAFLTACTASGNVSINPSASPSTGSSASPAASAPPATGGTTQDLEAKALCLDQKNTAPGYPTITEYRDSLKDLDTTTPIIREQTIKTINEHAAKQGC